MNVVTSENATEFEVHKFCTEASTLGIPPGRVQHKLETNLGNGRPFMYRTRRECGTIVYQQAEGCLQLLVYND